jgi:hypothetical protein
MSRPARRAVMEALGRLSSGFYADNLVLKQRLWRKVMRSVHPYSQIELSDAARRAADVIHSNGEYRTLDSLVEKALADGDTSTVIDLLSENRPHALLERLVEILRSARTLASAKKLAAAVEDATLNSSVTTLVRAYNGVAGANFDGVKLVRVAGRNNRMISTDHKDIPQRHIETVLVAITKALTARLAKADAPLAATCPTRIVSWIAVPASLRLARGVFCGCSATGATRTPSAVTWMLVWRCWTAISSTSPLRRGTPGTATARGPHTLVTSKCILAGLLSSSSTWNWTRCASCTRPRSGR